MKLDRDDIVLVGGCRTPFGTFGGALKDLTATDLAVAAKAALDSSRVRPEEIEHVVFGNVMQTSADAIYCAGTSASRPACRSNPGAHGQPALRLRLPGHRQRRQQILPARPRSSSPAAPRT